MSKKAVRITLLLCAMFATGIVWLPLLFPGENARQELYFLDVGQGDGQAIVLHEGMQQATVLIDAGPPGGAATAALDAIFGTNRKRIDIAIITHADRDHYGGMRDILRRYDVGLIVTNGRSADTEEWRTFMNAVRAYDIPHIALAENDRIIFGEESFSVLSPPALRSPQPRNEDSLVLLFNSSNMRALLTGDINEATERDIQNTHTISANILKIAHHGSKYSSSDSFLNTVSPDIAIIQVGKNPYGHPTQDVLNRLNEKNIRVYRTDVHGTIRVEKMNDRVRIHTERIAN